MRNKRGVALAIVVVVLGVIILWRRAHAFNGRSKREWISSLDKTYPSTSASSFISALHDEEVEWHKLGSNAVPILIEALQMKQTSIQRGYSNMWGKLPTNTRKLLPVPLNDVNIRIRAGSMLSSLASKYSIPLAPLALGLEDKEWMVRWSVLCVLDYGALKTNSAGKSTVLPAILRCAQDPHQEVRMCAAVDLQYFPGDAATVVPVLKSLMQDSPDVRVRAAMAFYRLDPRLAENAGVLAVLAQCLESANGVHGSRYLAAEFLAEMAETSDSAVDTLAKGLNSSDGRIRWLSAHALGTIGNRARPAASDLLRVSRTDQSAPIREEAMAALKKIGPEAAAKLDESQ